MTKFHINSKGIPAPCKATKGDCPFGGSSGAENHFDTLEEAQEFADQQNEAEYGYLSIKKTLTEKEIKPFNATEVQILHSDGNYYTGILSQDKDSITLRGYKNSKTIKVEDIDEIKAMSEHKYFSKEYKNELRAQNKPLLEHRFTKSALDEYKGKFIKVKYDGKNFDGEVIDTHYETELDNGLIIQSEDGEIKHIKNYRLEDIEKTGNNLKEHRQFKRLEELENMVDDDIVPEYYGSEPGRSETADFEEPSTVINNYFKAIIDKEKGLQVDLEKAGKHDFTEDLDRNSGAYDDSSRYYYDRERGGGQYAEWTEKSEEWYEEDVRAAEENEVFVEDRKEMINEIVKKVKEIDWTPYYDTQQEGVIDALEFLDSIGIATDY